MYYNLGELDEALNYALCAGDLFDINESSEYVQSILGASGAARSYHRVLWCSNRGLMFIEQFDHCDD